MYTAQTTGSSVRIRKTPSTGAAVVTTIAKKGTEIDVSLDYNYPNWLRVQYGSYSGYISARYVEIMEGNECSVNITSGALNIREKPSTNAAVLYTKKKDDALSFTEIYNGWVCVSCDQGTGWASKDYIFIPA